MLSFDLKPSEEIYEIEFEGVFIPQKFDPLWFFNNGLLGEEEAKSANIVKVEEDEILVFSTKFIRIIVEKEKFRIGTAQLLSLDLIKDMAVSIANILKDSLTGRFSYDLQLHIRFSNKKRLKQALNSIGGVDHWKGVLENPQSYSFRVIDESKSEMIKRERMINVYPCGRDDMPFTLHLYVFNIFTIRNKKQSVSAIVIESSAVFVESIALMNKLIKTHFIIQ